MHESQMSLPHNESGETNYTETNTTKKREDANRDGQPKLIYNTLRTALHFLPQTPENAITMLNQMSRQKALNGGERFFQGREPGYHTRTQPSARGVCCVSSCVP